MLLRHLGGRVNNGGLVSGFFGMLYLGHPHHNPERNVLSRIAHLKNVGATGTVAGVARSGITKASLRQNASHQIDPFYKL